MPNLTYAALHLTRVCSNRCSYCYIDAGKCVHPKFDKIKNIINHLAKNKIKSILLVGGDPCSYPYLKDVVKSIKKHDIRIMILSNTLGFGKDFNFYLDNIDDFEATVLGANAEQHDAEAGRKGAYDMLIKNMILLNSHGKKISIALSIHKNNYNNIYNIVENLIDKEKIDISEICIQRIIPIGRAANKDYFLEKRHIKEIFKQIVLVNKKYHIPIEFEDPFPLCVIPKKYRDVQKHPCEWGVFKASIYFDGSISRCGADNRCLLGNIFNIKDLQKFWNENSILTDFRSKNWIPKKCKECEMQERCRCGCSLSRSTNKDHSCDILCNFC